MFPESVAHWLPIPSGFDVVHTRHELHDHIRVTVTRAQPEAPLNYGGEHTSFVVGVADDILYGYTRQQAGYATGELPSPERARDIAVAFLTEVDRAFAEQLTVLWVDRHDETIRTAAGECTVAGMKVKARHSDGRYAWVIVAADETVLTYERAITWDAEQSRRLTGMWLHDRWIVAHDNCGPELPAPLAPVSRSADQNDATLAKDLASIG